MVYNNKRAISPASRKRGTYFTFNFFNDVFITSLLPTALAGKVKKSAASVRPFVNQSINQDFIAS